MKKMIALALALLSMALAGCKRGVVENMGAVSAPGVCIGNSPLAEKGGDCWEVVVPLDPASPTGYRIPSSLHAAFDTLDESFDSKMKRKLESLYKEDEREATKDKTLCQRDLNCARHLVGELDGLLSKTWGMRTCSPLVRGLRSQGVGANRNLTSLILIMYIDARLHPTRPGPYTGFLKAQNKMADDASGVAFLKDKGFVPGVVDEVSCP